MTYKLYVYPLKEQFHTHYKTLLFKGIVIVFLISDIQKNIQRVFDTKLKFHLFFHLFTFDF